MSDNKDSDAQLDKDLAESRKLAAENLARTEEAAEIYKQQQRDRENAKHNENK